ncbi:amidohydrolase family protein [Cohnella suwonensis]|uniref:Amidohydrolase family protein n=1 Tax=Cohnella suwonensis TaxID=696072 RepID=A0ABW0LX48_9BACL
MKILIKGAVVLTMDEKLGNFQNADILIQDSKIIEIGPDLEIEGCETIYSQGMIAIPGLIDTHRHVWQSPLQGIAADWTLMEYLQNMGRYGSVYRPEDVYVGNLFGAVQSINAGITTVLDWCHILNTPEHADAAVNGLRDSGSRAVFGHGNPGNGFMEWFYESRLSHPDDVRRVRQTYFSSDDQLVTMAMAIRGPEYSTFDVTKQDIYLARELGLRASMHVGGGTFGPHYQPIKLLDEANLLGDDLNFAHGCTLTEEDFKRIAATGGSLSVTPEVEMQMGLGNPATGRAISCGLRPGLGVDVVTAASPELFTQMKIALQADRARSNQLLIEEGKMPERVPMTTRDILKLSTIDGARTLGLDHKVGSLSPGKDADLVLLRFPETRPCPLGYAAAKVVLEAGIDNVDTVVVAGKIVKRNGKLSGHSFEKLRMKAEEIRERLIFSVESV